MFFVIFVNRYPWKDNRVNMLFLFLYLQDASWIQWFTNIKGSRLFFFLARARPRCSSLHCLSPAHDYLGRQHRSTAVYDASPILTPTVPGNEFFCQVEEDYIQDDFNLTGLSSYVPYYEHALGLTTPTPDWIP